MFKPCDFGHCDISRCTDKDCTSLTEEVQQSAVVECSKILPQHIGVLRLDLPCGAKTKRLYACGNLRQNKLLWMKGGIKARVS